MKSPVYFIKVDNADDTRAVKAKIERLIEKSRLMNCIRRDERAVIKMHFGEEGNTGFVRPEYVQVIQDRLKKKQAITALTDTNSLYFGRRANSRDHLQLAYEHGFTSDIVGAQVVIPDETRKENVTLVNTDGKFIRQAKLVTIFTLVESIVGVAHFKGHILTGFGGAIKNIGTGCAAKAGKMDQHGNAGPVIESQKCTGCELCVQACPAGAITMENGKAQIVRDKCVNCAECISVCKYEAVKVDWKAGKDTIQEKMVEYAGAVLKGKEKKCVFFNFLIRITQQCDCLAKDDPRIAPDIGILASNDPVSIDKASLDLINQVCGKEVFKQLYPDIDSSKQLNYAAKLGLGTLDYKLTEFKS